MLTYGDMHASMIMRLWLLVAVLTFSACNPGGKDSVPAYEFEQYTLLT